MTKYTKHIRSGPLLEIKMSKKIHAVVARRTFPSQNLQNTACSRHFWRFWWYRRKFRSQTSDNMVRWDKWKTEQGRGREKRKIRKEKIRREKVRRKKMQMRRKARKVAKQCVFPMICVKKLGKSRNSVFFQWFVAPESRKVGSLRRRVRNQLARWEMKICTPLKRETHFKIKIYKTHHSRTTFGSSDVEKVHAVMARSTFWNQNIQNTPPPDHFWKLRRRKSTRYCGAKFISKSTYTKYASSGPLGSLNVAKVRAAVV